MFIRTTYVLCNEVMALLAKAEEKTKYPKEELIVMVMRKMMRNNEVYERDEGRIEYQKRFDERTGERIFKRRVKMEFWIREYNYFQDMRRIFRRSISLLMAIAIFTYLEEIVKKIINKDHKALDADNYPFEGYAIMGKCIENITTYRIWWGLPPNLKSLLQK